MELEASIRLLGPVDQIKPFRVVCADTGYKRTSTRFRGGTCAESHGVKAIIEERDDGRSAEVRGCIFVQPECRGIGEHELDVLDVDLGPSSDEIMMHQESQVNPIFPGKYAIDAPCQENLDQHCDNR